MNLVRLRYADTPGLLDTTQLISGYQLQRSAFVGVASDTFPIRPNGGLAAQLQESPTFTFQPVTGDAYAHSFLRPLPPATLLPLAMGGLPIDVLMRLSVQSINMMSNNRPFSRNNGDIDDHINPNIGDFFELIHDLRLLQASGLLSIQLQQVAEVPGKSAEASHVYLGIASTRDPALLNVVARTRELLNFSPHDTRMEVVYGVGEPRPGEIRVLSRSMLSVLGQVAYQIQVPDDEVTSGSTTRHVDMSLRNEEKSLIAVHSGHEAPKRAFVSVFYDNYYYWVDKGDFESKVAFTITQMLFELSKTSQTPGALVTIPVSK
ncbi:hypothetical protein GLI01_31740 [Gluconacetobacter liquefaciens]|nr:hypothetical protein [Gluconacetobacter liquefaciens]GBR05286.1 hypothetical protein AA0522_1985 [Gluconacetobacter liquefaciens NRIC 0522]GEB39139.1 hypothetical protein GLI01_31740 [Gluconacetobacter liquefaciens]